MKTTSQRTCYVIAMLMVFFIPFLLLKYYEMPYWYEGFSICIYTIIYGALMAYSNGGFDA